MLRLHSLRRVLRGKSSKRVKPSRQLALDVLEDRCLLAAGFVQTNLVSDVAGLARLTDAHLRNPWGVALSPSAGAFWVSDAAAGVNTLYTGDVGGTPIASNSLVVTIPPAAGQSQGKPSGQVFNNTSDFVITSGGSSAPATFIFAGLDGTISAWNSGAGTQAVLKATTPGAVYTGLAIGSTGQANFLYAANVPGGRIDVFDRNFALVTPKTNTFVDPMLPAGLVPFNVQNINGILFVAYRNRVDRDHGGLVDEFDTSGRFIKRFAAGGTLNGPWGLTIAPANFGSFGGALLVGNFGDGRINAFNLNTGAFLGQLTDTGGQPIVLERLWALTTGNGVSAGDRNTVYFDAGIRNEQDGLFGSLRPANTNERFLGQVYQDLLQRPIDSTGLATWTSILAQGVSRTQVVQAIERTPEHRTVVVQSLYRTFLHRDADSGGINTFGNFLAQGATVEQVAVALAGSQEYFQSQSHNTNDGFLTALYRDALNRGIDSSGRTTFTNLLAAGATRAQVAAAIFASDEYLQDLVQSFYQKFLRRAAESTGLAAFTNFLKHGGRDEDAIASIVGSGEYVGRL